MIRLYYWPTPNGRKIAIMLEECGSDYEVVPVDLGRGDQFNAEFLALSPNNRMPAILDTESGIGLFESGAILLYLAEQSGQFLPHAPAERYAVLQWLFWQVAGLGPMAGELSHVVNYAPDSQPYARQRYGQEYDRLLGVMDWQLREHEYLAAELSIADFACFPWVAGYRRLGADLDDFPSLRRWFDALKARPALRRGMDLGRDWHSAASPDEARDVLFNQTAASCAARRA